MTYLIRAVHRARDEWSNPLDNSKANRGSKLELRVRQALKLYPTEAIYQFLDDPFAIVRDRVVEELQDRGAQLMPEQSAMSATPARKADLSLDEDDLYSLGSDLWLAAGFSGIRVMGYSSTLSAFGR